MNTSFLNRILFPFLLLISLLSCQSDPFSNNYLSMEIDGEFWETTNVSATLSQGGGLFIVNMIAQRENGEILEINIFQPNSGGAGAYVVSLAGNTNLRYDADGSLDANSLSAKFCPPPDGDIIISSIDEFQISGTFSGSVCSTTGSRIIRNGRFERILYQ